MTKRILMFTAIGLGSMLALGGLAALWLRFVTLGMRPWNAHPYTRQAILASAQEDSIICELNCYLTHYSDLRCDENAPGDSSTKLPLYRVFDSKGRLLLQHCCFESVPSFIDSTMRCPGWFVCDSAHQLNYFLSHLRRLEDNALVYAYSDSDSSSGAGAGSGPNSNSSSGSRIRSSACLNSISVMGLNSELKTALSTDTASSWYQFTVLYYWDTTNRYNIEKFRSFVRYMKSRDIRCRIVSVNYNTIRE